MMTVLQHCQSLIQLRANAYAISLNVQMPDSRLLTNVHANVNAIWMLGFAQIKLTPSLNQKLAPVFAKHMKRIALKLSQFTEKINAPAFAINLG